MKKSDILSLGKQYNVNMNDLFIGRGRGRLPLELIAEAKQRLTDAGWVPSLKSKAMKPVKDETTESTLDEWSEIITSTANFVQKDFKENQKLWVHSYGYGRLTKTKVTFLSWHAPGKAKVQTEQNHIAVLRQDDLHEIRV